jgi:hypothetical protein
VLTFPEARSCLVKLELPIPESRQSIHNCSLARQLQKFVQHNLNTQPHIGVIHIRCPRAVRPQRGPCRDRVLAAFLATVREHVHQVTLAQRILDRYSAQSHRAPHHVRQCVIRGLRLLGAMVGAAIHQTAGRGHDREEEAIHAVPP